MTFDYSCASAKTGGLAVEAGALRVQCNTHQLRGALTEHTVSPRVHAHPVARSSPGRIPPLQTDRAGPHRPAASVTVDSYQVNSRRCARHPGDLPTAVP
jgi:hypothetical protein